MEEFNVLVPKTYKYRVFENICYKNKCIDYKKAIIDRVATAEVKRFVDNCDCDCDIYTRDQIENLFTQGFVLVRISSAESILNYREHVQRGFKLMFMRSKEYQNLKKQFTFVEVNKNE